MIETDMNLTVFLNKAVNVCMRAFSLFPAGLMLCYFIVIFIINKVNMLTQITLFVL